MRIFIIILLIALLLWAIIDPPLRLKEKPSIFWITLLTLLIIPLTFFEAKWINSESKLNSITQEVLKDDKYSADPAYEEKNAGTHCQRQSEAFFDARASRLGEAYINGDQSFLTFKVCKDFNKFLETPYGQHTTEEIYSIGVASHEAFHLKGHGSESVTECLTRKHFTDILEFLKVPKQYFQDYYEKYMETSKRLPAQYQNGEC